VARRTASAPGSFAVAWLDALFTVTGDDLDELTHAEETVDRAL
jgi:hydroxyethylthiazole kinase